MGYSRARWIVIIFKLASFRNQFLLKVMFILIFIMNFYSSLSPYLRCIEFKILTGNLPTILILVKYGDRRNKPKIAAVCIMRTEAAVVSFWRILNTKTACFALMLYYLEMSCSCNGLYNNLKRYKRLLSSYSVTRIIMYVIILRNTKRVCISYIF